MRRVFIFSLLLIVGLVGSQFLPALGPSIHRPLEAVIKFLTMVGLGFIMIQVGLEFSIDKSRLGSYGWDYVVAASAAAFPWIFCAAYFVAVLPFSHGASNGEIWTQSLLAARFASPTSAGVLFSMLAAAGLGATWVFRKARILAIFDDLDTILLMIPLKMMIVGLKWELLMVVIIIMAQLYIAWRWMKAVDLPTSWPWVLGYATIIAMASDTIYYLTKFAADLVPIHIEVLLPAFVLGCIIRLPHEDATSAYPAELVLERVREMKVSALISGIFMTLVGLSMPPIFAFSSGVEAAVIPPEGSLDLESFAWVTGSVSGRALAWETVAWHVLVVTFIANLGKMFPAFCYRKDASFKERLALSIGMCPRGEVGAGVIVVSLTLGVKGPIVTVAMLSLALNLLMTGIYIMIIKALIKDKMEA